MAALCSAVTTRDQRKLAPKRQLFITEYLVDGNGKQAAIRAGYSPRSAEVEASRLLRNVQVAEAIAKRQAALRDKTGLTTTRVMEELACIGLSDPRRCFGSDGRMLALKDFPEDLARAIASVEVETTAGDKDTPAVTTTKVRFWEKPKALHTSAHILGMLKDKVEHSGTDGKPIRVSFGGRYRPADGAPSRKR